MPLPFRAVEMQVEIIRHPAMSIAVKRGVVALRVYRCVMAPQRKFLVGAQFVLSE